MPIYEFQCKHCSRESEILVRTTDWKGAKCPHCGSDKLAKKLSVFAAATGETGGDDAPACTGNPSGCGRCAPGFGDA
jgi:putative FmdB family regulatory protein